MTGRPADQDEAASRVVVPSRLHGIDGARRGDDAVLRGRIVMGRQQTVIKPAQRQAGPHEHHGPGPVSPACSQHGCVGGMPGADYYLRRRQAARPAGLAGDAGHKRPDQRRRRHLAHRQGHTPAQCLDEPGRLAQVPAFSVTDLPDDGRIGFSPHFSPGDTPSFVFFPASGYVLPQPDKSAWSRFGPPKGARRGRPRATAMPSVAGTR